MTRRVFVYYNLHKQLWSIRDQTTRTVVAHADVVTLQDAVFKVSEAGRRVLEDVYAGVEGVLLDTVGDLNWLGPSRVISYNLYAADHFFDVDTFERVDSAPIAVLMNKRVLIPAHISGYCISCRQNGIEVDTHGLCDACAVDLMVNPLQQVVQLESLVETAVH